MTDVVNVGSGYNTGDGAKARDGAGAINSKFAAHDASLATLTTNVTAVQAVTTVLGTPSPISALPLVSSLVGTESIPIVSGGVTSRTTVASFTGTAGSDTVARASIVGIKAPYIDFADYGTDPTGVADQSTILQQAISDAIAAKKTLRIPIGNYLLNSPIDLGPTLFQCFDMIGMGTWGSWLSNNEFTTQRTAVVFKANFNDRPAFFNSHGTKNLHLANFGIVGLNANPSMYGQPQNNVKANYVIAGCRDSQYSPYCGLLIDGFNNILGAPPDGGYPGMSAFYKDNAVIGASTGGIFDNISISGFVVGIGIELSGIVGGQGDTMLFHHCSVTLCDSCYAGGSAQSKDVVFNTGNLSSARTLINCSSYGNKAGCPPKVYGVNLQFAQRVFNLASAEAPFTLRDCYLESVRSIGNAGTTASTVRGHSTIADMQFKLQASVGPMPPIIFETFGVAKLENLNISNNGSFPANAPSTYNFANDLGSPIEVNTVTFNNWGTGGIPVIVGQTDQGTSVSLRNCLSYGTNGPTGNQPLSDISSSDVSAFSVTNRFSGPLRATLFANGVNDVLFQSSTTKGTINAAISSSSFTTRAVTFTGSLALGATSATVSGTFSDPSGWYDTTFSNGDTKRVLFANGAGTAATWGQDGLSASATSSVTALRVALSFTATDITLFQLGDMLLWKMLAQGGSTVQRYVPGWVVTNIAGSVVTCQALYDVNEYDIVANNGSSYAIIQPQWAPTIALTCTTATSTALTSVSPTTILKNGDWVSGAGLVANSRVVSGGGTASITLNKATNASASGVNLFFGRFQTPTITATW